MVEQGLYEVVYALAERYIPAGKHRLLHVDSRKVWTEIVVHQLKVKNIERKYSAIVNCAENWEALLIYKFSLQN